MAVLLIGVLVVVAIVLFLAPGTALLALLPLAAAVAVGVWLVMTISAGTTPTRAIRRTSQRQELLGPGGPDDPDGGR
jgi:hypothetical protein